ncbi:MAG: hypothetical protein E7165_02325 [Firmicutes bacterium]|nr:hypothetical protein [Bacillota bacterium]
MEIKKIAFTGGPCAGKTRVIEKISKILKKDGYYVINVEETAAQIIGTEIVPYNDREHTLRFQEYVYRLQSMKEQIAEEYAEGLVRSNLDLTKDKKGIIIIYDRGIMDNRAYISQEDYENLLNRHDCNEIKTIDKYDLVINLISLATTNPELYVLDGIRYEDVDVAAKRDEITSAAWLLHRNLKVIKPTKVFDEKVDIVLELIYKFLENKEKEGLDRFVLDKGEIDLSRYNSDNSRKIKINYVACYDTDKAFVLSKRQYNGKISYIKDEIDPESYKILGSKPISHDEYVEQLLLTPIQTVKEKTILSVIYNGVHFNLVETESGLLTLEVDKNNVEEIPNDIKRLIKRKIG